LKKGVLAVAPLAKKGARILGDIAMQSGTDFLGDILTGKNVKTAAKARAVEAANTAKGKPLVNYEAKQAAESGDIGPKA
jgi:hypothetical protein